MDVARRLAHAIHRMPRRAPARTAYGAGAHLPPGQPGLRRRRPTARSPGPPGQRTRGVASAQVPGPGQAVPDGVDVQVLLTGRGLERAVVGEEGAQRGDVLGAAVGVRGEQGSSSWSMNGSRRAAGCCSSRPSRLSRPSGPTTRPWLVASSSAAWAWDRPCDSCRARRGCHTRRRGPARSQRRSPDQSLVSRQCRCWVPPRPARAEGGAPADRRPARPARDDQLGRAQPFLLEEGHERCRVEQPSCTRRNSWPMRSPAQAASTSRSLRATSRTRASCSSSITSGRSAPVTRPLQAHGDAGRRQVLGCELGGRDCHGLVVHAQLEASTDVFGRLLEQSGYRTCPRSPANRRGMSASRVLSCEVSASTCGWRGTRRWR